VRPVCAVSPNFCGEISENVRNFADKLRTESAKVRTKSADAKTEIAELQMA
jgi:hypothetical protein